MAVRADISVTYEDHMGSDLLVVNAARVSFAKRVSEIGPSDQSLLLFLARGMDSKEYEKLQEEIVVCQDIQQARELISRLTTIQKHFAPFTHPTLCLHVKAPLFVMRQLLRSNVGLTVSEVSRRYVTDEPSFYPLEFRAAPANRKQGSGGQVPHDVAARAVMAFTAAEEDAVDAYQTMLEENVAPEQARAILPQTLMTELFWTGSLYAWARVCMLRLDAHAQQESRQVALGVYEELKRLYPLSTAALLERWA